MTGFVNYFCFVVCVTPCCVVNIATIYRQEFHSSIDSKTRGIGLEANHVLL